MAVRSRRAKPGDVLELVTPDGFIYLQYLGKHPEYGDAVFVSPEKHPSRVDDLDQLFKAAYVTFYPARAAVAQELATVIGHFDSPSVPKRLRRPGAQSGNAIETWVIEDDSGEIVRQNLSQEERELPIAAIWNHEFLIQRVSEGWRPADKS